MNEEKKKEIRRINKMVEKWRDGPDLRESDEAVGPLQGLKDNQIHQLVNAVRDATTPMIPHQCLRGVIAAAVTKYLEQNGLRIDKA
jgi:hypothetical protein